MADAIGNTIITTYKEDIYIKKTKAGYYDLETSFNTIKNISSYEVSEFVILAQLLTTYGAYIQNVTKIHNLTLLLSLRRE